MSEVRTETEILFPAKRIPISRGRHAVVEPWGFKTGMLLTPKVIQIAADAFDFRNRFQKGEVGEFTNATLIEVIVKYQQEVADIIQETLGYDDGQMAELDYEDIFTLSQAVLDVCIIREGSQDSPLVKMVTLLGFAHQSKGEEISATP